MCEGGKTMKRKFAIGILLTALVLAGGLLLNRSSVSIATNNTVTPVNFDCQFEANTHGSLQSTNIYLRNNAITLASDDQKGSRTWVSLPLVFDHGSGTSPKGDLPLPNGTFKVSMKVRLAGNKTPGPIGVWLSKRNVVRLEVHDGSVSGPIIGQASIDRSVGSPTDYTLNTNAYSPNQPVDTFRTYYIMIFFDKYDSNGSNDGQCGMEIRVRSI
jgi:hypothetical protein